MNFLNRCEEIAKRLKPTVVFADAFDPRIIEAAQFIKNKQLGFPILLGAPVSLRSFAEDCKLTTRGLKIMSPMHDPDFVKNVKMLVKQRESKGLTKSEADKLLRNPLYYSAVMVKKGIADLCISGNISSTADVLRSAIQVIGTAEGTKTVSSFYIMQSPDERKIFAFGDCSVVPRPTAEQLSDIAINTAHNFTQITGEEACVAMLSFSTNGSANHEMVDTIKRAIIMLKEKAPTLNLVESEIQFDAAIVPEIGNQKFPGSKGKAGHANVLIFPSLNAGNIGYKIAERIAGYTALGPFGQGLKKPVQDLSRGCTMNDIVKTYTAVTALI
ncbi:MAG: phosphate acetyltransferase [Calditrichaceae bacterium]|jgi:phosphotransacetylase